MMSESLFERLVVALESIAHTMQRQLPPETERTEGEVEIFNIHDEQTGAEALGQRSDSQERRIEKLLQKAKRSS